jgi:hypothetical protein
VTRHNTTAVQVTPVKIARNGSRWTAKKGIEETFEIRPWGSRSVEMGTVQHQGGVGVGAEWRLVDVTVAECGYRR